MSETNVQSIGDIQMILALEVTEEQRETMYHLFAHYDWEYRQIEVKDKMLEQINEDGETTTVSDNGDNSEDKQYIIDQDKDANECVYCLCRPCITDERNRQMWWESENGEPHIHNSLLRKGHYKRFWTNLFHRQVWRNPIYIRRKQQAISSDCRQCNYAKMCTRSGEVVVS